MIGDENLDRNKCYKRRENQPTRNGMITRRESSQPLAKILIPKVSFFLSLFFFFFGGGVESLHKLNTIHTKLSPHPGLAPVEQNKDGGGRHREVTSQSERTLFSWPQMQIKILTKINEKRQGLKKARASPLVFKMFVTH